MKKLFLIAASCISIGAYCQSGTISARYPNDLIYGDDPASLTFNIPKYPEKDTLKCHFIEVVNDSSFQWKSGFVVRNSGHINFGKTSVTEEYLPITSGVITSPLFYSDMRPINNYAIKIVIKTHVPTN